MEVNKTIVAVSALSLLLVAVFVAMPDVAYAQLNVGNIKPDGTAGTTTLPGLVKGIINTLLAVIGIIAVVMLILGGIRYTTSQGDATAIKEAKNTILYAIIGIVVAFAAFALVNYIVTQLNTPPPPPAPLP